MTHPWIAKLFLGHAARPTLKPRPRTRLGVESLEDRTVPAVITVNTLADTVDANSAVTSLREAITAANSIAGDDTIDFSVAGTINLTGVLPNLDSNLAIQGSGADRLTVRRIINWDVTSFDRDYRIFTVPTGRTVALTGLTITGGQAPSSNGYAAGGGILNGGTLTVSSSVISNNSASALNGHGGGIFNAGTLTVIGSTLSGNSAYGESGGTATIGAAGGGIYNGGTLTVVNSTFSGNALTGPATSRSWGGGIFNDGTLTVNNSTFTGHTAQGQAAGGGIYTHRRALTMNNSLVVNTSGGGDVFGDFTGNHNLLGTLALGPLQDNGGPTPTHAPGSGPAVNAGNNAFIPAGVTTDQRGPGFARIFGGTVDIGAFEAGPNPTITRDQAAVTVNEGSTARNTGTFDDPQGRGTVTLTASQGRVTQYDATGNWVWDDYLGDGPTGPTTVTITATDAGGLTASTTFTLTVNNVAPTINGFEVPAVGVVGSPVTLFANASDPAGYDDPRTYTWTVTRPDGSTFTLTRTNSNHVDFTPTDDGLYGVGLTVSDGDGGTARLSQGVQAPSGLVSWWPADVYRGYDEGGHVDIRGRNGGTSMGRGLVGFAPGRVGQAFSFDGYRHIEVPDAAGLDLTEAVTLEAWVNRSSQATADGDGAVIAKNGGGFRNYSLNVWQGGVHLSYYTTGGVEVRLDSAANLIPIGQFNHIAGVIDPAAGVMKIYLNGLEVASRATGGPLVTNDAPLTIGRAARTASGDLYNSVGFAGLIDEPSVYNRALGQAEIQAVVNAGDAGKSLTVAVPKVALAATTAVTTSAARSTYGDSVTFTATVTGISTPTGTVNFVIDGGTPVAGIAGGTPGTWTFTTSTLSAGTHTVQAVFDGSGSFADSTGALSGGQIVNKANATIVVTPYTVTYDGSPHAAAVSAITGVNGETGAAVGTVNVSGTTHTNAGMYSDSWSFTSVNYNAIAGTAITNVISKASSTTTVSIVGGPFTYTGSAQTPATVTVTGAGGLSLTPAATYANNVNADTATAAYTYAGDANHTGSSDTQMFTIGKAATAVAVGGYAGGTYDGGTHTQTVTVIGVNGGQLYITSLTGTNAGNYGLPWSFSNANYHDVGGTLAFAIAKVASSIAVTINGGPFTYSGLAQTPATVTVTGAGGLSLTPAATYANNVNAGTATASYSYIGDDNHEASSGSNTFIIGKATAAVVVGGYTGGTYDGGAHTQSVTVTGVNGGQLYTTSLSGTNAGGYSQAWSYTNANYHDVSGTLAFAIAKANATFTVTPYTVTYDGQAHAATVSAIAGVNGEAGATVGTVTLSTTHTNAGTYTDSWSFAGTANYNDIAATTVTNVINRAALTITANNDVKVHGTLKTFSGTAFAQSGLVNGDAITGVTETSAGAATAAAVGIYAIVPSAATGTGLGNYAITYVNGALTVFPALTVPAAQTAYEDVDKAISGITIASGLSGSLTLTLGVGHGTLTLGTITGLTVTGNGSGSVSLVGSTAALNAALATLVYRGSLNFGGADALSLTVGNGSFSSNASVAITVVSAAQQVAELEVYVNGLVASGRLTSGQGEALNLNLRANNGDAGKVQAFLNQVAAFRQAGILTQAEADPLLVRGNTLLLSVTRR